MNVGRGALENGELIAGVETLLPRVPGDGVLRRTPIVEQSRKTTQRSITSTSTSDCTADSLSSVFRVLAQLVQFVFGWQKPVSEIVRPPVCASNGAGPPFSIAVGHHCLGVLEASADQCALRSDTNFRVVA